MVTLPVSGILALAIAANADGLTPPAAAVVAFARYENRSATSDRVLEVRQALGACARALAAFMPKEPAPLLVVTYGDENTFVRGLQDELGFDRASAETFRKSGAPRPLRGKMLVPLSQAPIDICHELTHHFLERHVETHKLLDVKWFDEGVAGYLAKRITGSDDRLPDLKWLRDRQWALLEPSEMTGKEQWHQLFAVPQTRALAYAEARALISYFFEKYSTEGFRAVIAGMERGTFDAAFASATGTDVQAFFASWRREVVGTASDAPRYLIPSAITVRRQRENYVVTLKMDGLIPTHSPDPTVFTEWDLLLDTDRDPTTHPWGWLPFLEDVGVDSVVRLVLLDDHLSASVADFRQREHPWQKCDFRASGSTIELTFKAALVGDPPSYDYAFAARELGNRGDPKVTLHQKWLPKRSFDSVTPASVQPPTP